MSGLESPSRSFRRQPVFVASIAAMLAAELLVSGVARADDAQPPHEVVAKGAELFAREWLPRDPGDGGSDGLGPVYNETSCVACHFQGGPGGAGPTSMNVEILSAGTVAASGKKGPSAAEFHPGFRTARSVVLHRFGVDPVYKAWRLRLLGDERRADMVESVDTEIQQVQELIEPLSSRLRSPTSGPLLSGMVVSQRNAPALFGAGLIDAVPAEVVLAGEKQRFPEFPEISGRVNRGKDDRIGRFGWKAESPSLNAFVVAACANELGLEVPGAHQASSPLDPDAQAKGLDLTQDECDALVAYIRHLPVPTAMRPAANTRESAAVAEGRTLFGSAGCATCHQARLGKIDGIYSDLLLHDMGRALSDSGRSYGQIELDPSPGGPATPEWRTPPLWGFRESGPYLHDGRAKNVEEAVALHGGEAEQTTRRFFKLLPEQRLRVQAFLRSLAPPAAADR